MSSVSAPDVFDQKQTEICPNHRLCRFLCPPAGSSLLSHPCSCSLLDYKFLGVCVPCAECQQQLRLNSNWHLMISCYLSLSLFYSACYAQPLSGWSSSSSWHTTRSHVANLRRRRTSGSVIRSSRGSSHKSQCFGLTASPAGTLTLWPAWLRSGAAHALPARRCLQAVG